MADRGVDAKDAGSLVIEHLEDGILSLTLNRPEKLNALDLKMVEALHGAVDRLDDHDDVRVVIISGAGDKAFVAGADIAQLRQRGREDALAAINSELFLRIDRIPVPTIAAVRGFALGGGCELAIACDLRVAGRSARFGQPEVGLGIMAGAGATYRLPALIGPGRARDLLYTGRIIDAEEALSMGLVNRVVDDEELEEAARSLAAKIARNDALAVRFTKAALAQHESRVLAGQAFESSAQAVLFESPEKLRRMDRFLQRTAAKKGKDG